MLVFCSLEDVYIDESSLFLIFEYLPMDLRRFMVHHSKELDPALVKVNASILFLPLPS